VGIQVRRKKGLEVDTASRGSLIGESEVEGQGGKEGGRETQKERDRDREGGRQCGAVWYLGSRR
jgi:hypothetical protein